MFCDYGVFFYIQWLSDCCARVTALGVFGDKIPNHVLVNEYTPGQGIMVSMCCWFLAQEWKLYCHAVYSRDSVIFCHIEQSFQGCVYTEGGALGFPPPPV